MCTDIYMYYVSPQRMHGTPLPFRIQQRYKYDSQLTCDGRCQCVLVAFCPFNNSQALGFIPPGAFFFLLLFSFFLFFIFILFLLFLVVPSFFLIIFSFFFHGKLLVGGTIPSTKSNIASSRNKYSSCGIVIVGNS